MSPSHRVCIIGGGPQGLSALKNLLELNDQDSGGESLFQVDLLESRHSIGGIWTFTNDSSEITALRNTVQNTSRFRNCYSDFPVADAWKFGGRDDFPPAYLTQEQSAFYLEQYARKFDLRNHIKFGRRVVDLHRDDAKEQWQIEVLNTETAEKKICWYDKVIVATGQHHDPMLPRITGMEHFRGQSLHAAKFKGGEPFRNQTVLLVGSSNSAGDVATEVATAAASVIVSRRRGVIVAPRMSRHRPNDITLTRRMDALMWFISSFAPAYFAAKIAEMMKTIIAGGWKGRIKPEWNLNPENAASICFQAPMVTDTIVPLLEANKVRFVPEIRLIREDGRVELHDHQILRVDAIIFCTGYDIDSTLAVPIQRTGELKLPRLYHNIYHPKHPTSLAYLTFWFTIAGIYELGDLASMGVAQVFAGRYQLPSRNDMDKHIDAHHAFVNDLASRVPRPISLQAAARCLDRGPWITFLHKAAGTEALERLSYGFKGWQFWWSDRKFCHLLMTGVNSIHIARLFDGRPGARKKWAGAKRAIIEANDDLQRIEKDLSGKDNHDVALGTKEKKTD